MVDYDPQTDHTPQVLNERSGAPWLELIEVPLELASGLTLNSLHWYLTSVETSHRSREIIKKCQKNVATR